MVLVGPVPGHVSHVMIRGKSFSSENMMACSHGNGREDLWIFSCLHPPREKHQKLSPGEETFGTLLGSLRATGRTWRKESEISTLK